MYRGVYSVFERFSPQSVKSVGEFKSIAPMPSRSNYVHQNGGLKGSLGKLAGSKGVIWSAAVAARTSLAL